MPASDRRGNAGRQEGAGWAQRRHARKRAIVEGSAARFEETRTDDWTEACRRRRRTRILASGRGGMAQDTWPALLGAQDGERLKQAAEKPATEGQPGAAGHLDGRNKKGR